MKSRNFILYLIRQNSAGFFQKVKPYFADLFRYFLSKFPVFDLTP